MILRLVIGRNLRPTQFSALASEEGDLRKSSVEFFFKKKQNFPLLY